MQHLLDPGPRRGRDRGARASPCSPGRARRSRSTGGAPSRRCAGPTASGPNMILDDGGDATLVVHKGVEYERAGAVPDPSTADSEELRGRARRCSRRMLPRTTAVWHRMAEGMKGVTEETTTGVHRLYQMHGERHAAVPGDQRERLGHEVEVRQPLRLPPLARRRHLPRHRRHARGQGRGGVRLRRRRQGLRAVAARPGRARHRHRDRPDLRAAGGDGGLPGRARSTTSSRPPTCSSPPPATRRHHRRRTWRG